MHTLLPSLDRTRLEADAALSTGDLGAVHAKLCEVGGTEDVTWRVVSQVTEEVASLEEMRALHARFLNACPDTPPGLVERVVLLRAFRRSLEALPQARLSEPVQQLICEEVRFIIEPPPAVARRYHVNRNSLVGFCKLATLRRFPAGQLTWEISGMQRSWLLRARARDLPRLWWLVAARLRGLGPLFVPHLSATRRDRTALLERETNRAYYRMATTLALQPEVKGLAAGGWLHSPDTMAASPHLTSFNRLFMENGALITTIGPADPECGVFYRSPERRKLYDEGRFKPTIGLVLWPREAMLAWAAQHPELAA